MNFLNISKLNSVRNKFAIPVILFTVILLTLSSFYKIHYERIQYTLNSREKAINITELAALTFVDPLWNFNIDGIQMSGLALLKDKEIGYLEVTDSSNKEIYKFAKTEDIYINSNWIYVDKNITKENIKIGHVKIGLTDYFEQQTIKQNILNTTVQNTILTIILWIVIFTISYYVTEPIKKLKNSAEEMADGNLNTRINIKSRDEIGELSIAFNFMAESLSKMIFKVKENAEIISYTDILTGLPNRGKLTKSFTSLVKETTSHNCKLALLLIDIDNFKNINDTLGHPTGDEIIKTIAQTLSTKNSKDIIVTRFGGDEFTILMSNVNKIIDVAEFSEEILKLFHNPFHIDDNDINITISMGISIFPDDAQIFDKLLMNADVAMYKVKKNGKNAYQFFNKSLNEELIRKVWIENGLREAIDKNELKVFYQPIVNLKTNKILNCEALLRWITPDQGIISPSEFIPIAEETGQINLIGKWVLRTACETVKKWNDTLQLTDNIVVSVNLSPVQLRQKNIVDLISNVLEETKLDPKFLVLEITEGIFIDYFDEAVKIIEEIRDLGIKISLDDFGTGFSSLSYLKHLPINILKIDKSFIKDLNINQREKVILKSIISLAQKLDLNVVVEGVEDINQLKFIKSCNCDKVQGFLFSKPVDEESFEKLITTSSQSIFIDEDSNL